LSGNPKKANVTKKAASERTTQNQRQFLHTRLSTEITSRPKLSGLSCWGGPSGNFENWPIFDLLVQEINNFGTFPESSVLPGNNYVNNSWTWDWGVRIELLEELIHNAQKEARVAGGLPLEMNLVERAQMEVEAHKILLEYAGRLELTQVEQAALKLRLQEWETILFKRQLAEKLKGKFFL
jgi:hypothetical protein